MNTSETKFNSKTQNFSTILQWNRTELKTHSYNTITQNFLGNPTGKALCLFENFIDRNLSNRSLTIQLFQSENNLVLPLLVLTLKHLARTLICFLNPSTNLKEFSSINLHTSFSLVCPSHTQAPAHKLMLSIVLSHQLVLTK